MWSELLGPPGLILLAAIIGGVGAFWAAIKQSHLRARSEGNAVVQIELLRDIVSRGGNEKELEELIRARSRVLNSDPNKADDVAAGIIKRLPELTAEFKALERNKLDAYDRKVTEFRLKWEPLIQLVLNKFDSLVADCQKRGIDLRNESVPFPDFPRALNNPRQRPSYKTRSVKFHDAELFLEYEPLIVFESGYSNSQLKVYSGEHLAFILALGLNDGYCQVMIAGASDMNSGPVEAPKDGIAPTSLVTFVEDGFAKVFERFLVAANAYADIPEEQEQPR